MFPWLQAKHTTLVVIFPAVMDFRSIVPMIDTTMDTVIIAGRIVRAAPTCILTAATMVITGRIVGAALVMTAIVVCSTSTMVATRTAVIAATIAATAMVAAMAAIVTATGKENLVRYGRCDLGRTRLDGCGGSRAE